MLMSSGNHSRRLLVIKEPTNCTKLCAAYIVGLGALIGNALINFMKKI